MEFIDDLFILFVVCFSEPIVLPEVTVRLNISVQRGQLYWIINNVCVMFRVVFLILFLFFLTIEKKEIDDASWNAKNAVSSCVAT